MPLTEGEMAFFFCVRWPVSDQCLWVKILFYSSVILYFSHADVYSVLALFSLFGGFDFCPVQEVHVSMYCVSSSRLV